MNNSIYLNGEKIAELEFGDDAQQLFETYKYDILQKEKSDHLKWVRANFFGEDEIEGEVNAPASAPPPQKAPPSKENNNANK